MERFEKPWFSKYRERGIPYSLEPYPLIPTHALLDQAAEKCKKMGLVQMGYTMLYPEVRDRSERLANALAGFGVEKGDRVATLLPTSIQFVLADTAISKAGAVHVPSSFLEPPDRLEHKFKESGPRVVITLDEHINVVNALRKRVSLEDIIVTRLTDFSSSILPEPPALETGIHWLNALIESHPPKVPSIDFDVKRDLETLLFTGGTTGLPKGCMLTHYNLVANCWQNNGGMGHAARTGSGYLAVLVGTPFFHSYGHCIMHTMIYLGMMQLLVPDPRDTRAMIAMIKEHRPVLQIGVPTQFMKMLNEDLKDVYILGISGSAALPPEIHAQFEQRGAGVIMEGYGLSEMTSVTHTNPPGMTRTVRKRRLVTLPRSNWLLRKLLGLVGYRRAGYLVGRLLSRRAKSPWEKPELKSQEKRGSIGIPLPDTEVKVIDIDTGMEITLENMVKESKVGEMLLKGPQRMLGYWPEEGKGYDEDGYVHTGDVVKIDNQGYFYIVDRTKDMINVSGYKVYSRELDDILHNHPAVALAATVGVPDEERSGSERVKVFIQLKPDFKGKVTEQEIISYLRGKVAKYAVPRSISFIDEMPLTEVQKVNKKYLREMELQRRQEHN